MSFLVTAALAIALLVAVPVLAHLFRRGKATEQEFPAAHWVPSSPPLARQRSRLEDGLLLGIRGSLIVTLAILGAVPLVRCSRLSLTRDHGASVALALVVDDSLSMRLLSSGGTSRWIRAQRELKSLLSSTREGDAVAVVLAGSPARLVLAATTDLASVQSTIEALEPSDRGTDLASAVQLARGALQTLPHRDKRVLLFSDMEAEPIPEGTPPVFTALTNLGAPSPDCAVISAEQQGKTVTATIACNTQEASQGRRLDISADPNSVLSGKTSTAPPSTGLLASIPIAAQSGIQSVSLDLPQGGTELIAKLVGPDSLAHDDQAPVATDLATLRVAVVADPSRSSVATGGPTLVEQGLASLESRISVHPLLLIPDQPKELEEFAALILDDPSAFGPEVRNTLSEWVAKRGVALALLGPSVDSVQLGSSLEPFAQGALLFSPTVAPGLNPDSLAWLGPVGASFSDLGARARVNLDEAAPQGSHVRARWSDGKTFLFEHDLGQGLLLTAGLPASASHSDLAFRPGFLGLLDHVIKEAIRRSGQRVTEVGTPWTFPGQQALQITQPSGVRVEQAPRDADHLFFPEQAGRYRITLGGQHQDRIATLDPHELSWQALPPSSTPGKTVAAAPVDFRELSGQFALLALGLFTGELLLRGFRRMRRQAAGSPKFVG